jgi:hypothetical protein
MRPNSAPPTRESCPESAQNPSTGSSLSRLSSDSSRFRTHLPPSLGSERAGSQRRRRRGRKSFDLIVQPLFRFPRRTRGPAANGARTPVSSDPQDPRFRTHLPPSLGSERAGSQRRRRRGRKSRQRGSGPLPQTSSYPSLRMRPNSAPPTRESCPESAQNPSDLERFG